MLLCLVRFLVCFDETPKLKGHVVDEFFRFFGSSGQRREDKGCRDLASIGHQSDRIRAADYQYPIFSSY